MKDKANILCILHILKEYSDADNILSVSKIITYLKNIYDIDVERRSIYRNIEILKELGYDISVQRENHKGYYLISREFEESELHFLIDAVYSASYISSKATNELVEKLQSFRSIGNRKQYAHLKNIGNDIKTPNKYIFYNIDILEEAITNEVKVSFDYMTYDMSKKLTKRREKKYIASPLGMVCANEKYYLLCIYERYSEISVARIDRILNIETTNRMADKTEVDIYDYAKKSIYMYGGEAEKIVLKCHKHILNDILDKFGTNLDLKQCNDADYFQIQIELSVAGLKYWILQYINYIDVIAPISLRKEVLTILENAYKRYKQL